MISLSAGRADESWVFLTSDALYNPPPRLPRKKMPKFIPFVYFSTISFVYLPGSHASNDALQNQNTRISLYILSQNVMTI